MSNQLRFTPASIDAFKRTARDVQRAYPIGLQNAQEALAKTYGYPDLHALQEHLKTSPEPGPYPRPHPRGAGLVRPFSSYGVFERIARSSPTGLLSIEDLYIFDEPHIRKQAMDDNSLGGTHILYLLHPDTLRTRHCRLTWSQASLGFGSFLSAEETAQGWEWAESETVVGATSEYLAARELQVASQSRDYWTNLHEETFAHRAVHDRKHYVMHELGHGRGFGGAAFEVAWLDGRPPTVCNLSAQGRVPAWITHLIPDNARVRELTHLERRSLGSPLNLTTLEHPQ